MPNLDADAIAADAAGALPRAGAASAIVAAFGAPPIDGLGTTGGFKLIVEDRGNLGLAELQRVSDRIVARGSKTAGLQGPLQQLRANTPWLYLDIDRDQVHGPGRARSATSSTLLQVYLGSYYVNNFNEYRPYLAGERAGRSEVSATTWRRHRQLQVRNNQGQMVRLGTLMDVRNTSGPVMVMRYNIYSAAAITGNAGPDTSSGQAVALDARDRRQGAAADRWRTEWTGLAYLQQQAGNAAMYFFRPGRGFRVSGAGGAVRKLEAAAGGDPGRADVPALLGRRRAIGGHRR